MVLIFICCACCRGHFYPGTGAVTEVGHPGAEGTTVNVPWPCGGMRNGDYMAAFQHLVLPIAYGEFFRCKL